MNVHFRHCLFHCGNQLQIGIAVVMRVNTTLHAHFCGAAVPGFLCAFSNLSGT
ncbi:hypothetical protein D3C85_1056210 [compost metagenome]